MKERFASCAVMIDERRGRLLGLSRIRWGEIMGICETLRGKEFIRRSFLGDSCGWKRRWKRGYMYGICCGVKRWFERRGIWGWIDEGEIVKGKKEVRLIGLENSEQMGKYGTKEKKSVGLIGLLWMWCECRQKRKNRKEKVGWQMILSFVFVKKTWLGNELERKRNVLGKRI